MAVLETLAAGKKRMTKKKLLIKNALLVDPKNEVEFIAPCLLKKELLRKSSINQVRITIFQIVK